jgi:hypothetical protein
MPMHFYRRSNNSTYQLLQIFRQVTHKLHTHMFLFVLFVAFMFFVVKS